MSDKCSSQQREMIPLTEYQLSARQADMGKLPNFAGEPEEWPLFYSLYRSSTVSCGFSDVENALRLRRHLKGKALKAVRILLIHPSTVDKAIERLKMQFGRPELLCLSMIKKMRQLKPPQEDNLSMVMTFGFAVKNMCLNIEETGRSEYLYSHTVLRELVAKLPTYLQLEWVQKDGSNTGSLAPFGRWIGELATAICMLNE